MELGADPVGVGVVELGEDGVGTPPGVFGGVWVATEAAEREVVPAVPVTVEPGDVVAIDLHVWHCCCVRHPRILWAPEFLAWPVEPAQVPSLEEKFTAVAAAGALDSGGPEWPVWRDWPHAAGPSDGRRRAVEMLRGAGAFQHGRDLRQRHGPVGLFYVNSTDQHITPWPRTPDLQDHRNFTETTVAVPAVLGGRNSCKPGSGRLGYGSSFAI
ncbi:MAG TPA: hypothetical protein VFM54_12110 [Micromonosporaceae bacterium]|nr:hypothetical protein [Micromonosporaceae bacterium]